MKLVMILLFVTVGALLDRSADAFPRCPPCTDGSCDPPDNCEYGVKPDICGRMVCARGPGQMCGGKFNARGMCGEGTFCLCNRCIGCSLLKPECFTTSNSAKCV